MVSESGTIRGEVNLQITISFHQFSLVFSLQSNSNVSRRNVVDDYACKDIYFIVNNLMQGSHRVIIKRLLAKIQRNNAMLITVATIVSAIAIVISRCALFNRDCLKQTEHCSDHFSNRSFLLKLVKHTYTMGARICLKNKAQNAEQDFHACIENFQHFLILMSHKIWNMSSASPKIPMKIHTNNRKWFDCAKN